MNPISLDSKWANCSYYKMVMLVKSGKWSKFPLEMEIVKVAARQMKYARGAHSDRVQMENNHTKKIHAPSRKFS